MAGRDLEVLRLLGEGGHGAVYLARHRASLGFERLVALKVVRENARLAGSVAERFVHEARLLGLLRHRAIVIADDVVELDIGTAIVMEYVPGIDLFDVVRLSHARPGSVPAGWLAHVGLEVASALAAAWASPSPVTGQPLKVLHCDVKPSNVRISRSGEVKLLDFGVSTSLIDDTVDGPIMGTLGFVAPERLEQGVVGPASDLFSLGLTLLSVALGRGMQERPIDSAALGPWISRALHAMPSVYACFGDLLRDLLSIEPELRPDHEEVCARLFTILRDESNTPPADLSGCLVEAVSMMHAEQVSPPETEPDDGLDGDRVRSGGLPDGAVRTELTLHPVGGLSSTMGQASESDGLSDELSLVHSSPTSLGSSPSVPPRPRLPSQVPLPVSVGHSVAADGGEDRTVGVSADQLEISRVVAAWSYADTVARAEPVRRGRDWEKGPVARVFAACAQFSGWFDIEQAQAVLGPELHRTGHALPRVLEGLVADGLLQGARRDGVAHARVAPGYVARAAHVLARWPEQERSELRARHVAHLVSRASDQWLDRLSHGLGLSHTQVEMIEGDLQRAEFWATGSAAISCAVALLVLGTLREGWSAERARTVRALLARADLLPEDRVRIIRWQGQLSLDAPRMSPRRSIELVDLGIDDAKDVGDAHSEAALWTQRAFWLVGLGDQDEALEALEEARLLSERLDDPLRSCVVSAQLVSPLARSGQRAEAKRLARQTEQACRFLGAKRLSVDLICELATLAREDGDAVRALRYASRAVHMGESLRSSGTLAKALACRGLVYLAAGESDAAVEDLREAQASLRDTSAVAFAWNCAWLAGALLAEGRVAEAGAALRQLEDQRQVVFGESAVVVAAWRAHLAVAQGRKDEATSFLQSAEQACATLESLKSPTLERLMRKTRATVASA